MKTRLTLGALVLSVVGCGGSVERVTGTGATGGTSTGGSGAFGGGGAGGVTGGAGGSVTGGSGGMAGTGGFGGMAGMGGGTGGSIACGHGNDSLTVDIQPGWSTVPGCPLGGAETSVWQETGSVVKSDGYGFFVMDTCPPNADCAGSFTTVTIKAAGLSLYVPVGAFVTVKLEQIPAWGGCLTRLSVRNVPTWGGAGNPAGGGDMFHFIGVDGVLDHPDAPFVVGKVPLGCYDDTPSCGEPADDFALSFSVGAGMGATVVGMGQTAMVSTPGQPMLVHDLRSYVSGWCDDYWNWAWWAVPAYLK